MRQAFMVAFEAWETAFRDDPGSFMTNEEQAAALVATLSEQRTIYFMAILNKLADGKPWDTIGSEPADT